MSRLRARILKLERLLPTDLEAELAAMSDEDLERRCDAILRELSEDELRGMAREYPNFYTPEVLEKKMARWRELHVADKRARGNAL